MMCKKSPYYCRLLLVGLACCIPLTFANRPASADEPEGVIRTFIVLDAPETVDFLHEDSVMVQAKQANNAPVLFQFVDNNPELSEFDFNGTLWASGPAMYITKGNGLTEIGSFAWLIDEHTPEPPPTGALTLTGPDALLIQETVTFSVCDGSCGSGNDGKLELVAFGSSRLVVVTAIFNK